LLHVLDAVHVDAEHEVSVVAGADGADGADIGPEAASTYIKFIISDLATNDWTTRQIPPSL